MGARGAYCAQYHAGGRVYRHTDTGQPVAGAELSVPESGNTTSGHLPAAPPDDWWRTEQQSDHRTGAGDTGTDLLRVAGNPGDYHREAGDGEYRPGTGSGRGAWSSAGRVHPGDCLAGAVGGWDADVDRSLQLDVVAAVMA